MTTYIPSIHSSPLEITGTLSHLLEKKRILIGVCGSVAVTESVTLARLLMRHGATVFTAMTPASTTLIQPGLLTWATGTPAITQLTGQIEHVHLAGQHPDKVDLVLIAPATANTIGKIAHGIDDNPVTTIVSTALGTGIPIAIVPAMHATMYKNPLVVNNIDILKKIGITFIGPRMEEGKAKFAKAEEILEAVITLVTTQDLAGKHVVITAGPTRVWIDDVRFISNASSGKMGIAIALEAANRGAKVSLILGSTSEPVPNSNIEILPIETPADILDKITALAAKYSHIDYFISAAAIADYEPESQEGKIASGQKELVIHLKPTPKILAYAKEKFATAKIIGFKAESKISKEELLIRAEARLQQYDLDMIIANLVSRQGQGFGTTTNQVSILSKGGQKQEVVNQHKRLVAKIIMNQLMKL